MIVQSFFYFNYYDLRVGCDCSSCIVGLEPQALRISFLILMKNTKILDYNIAIYTNFQSSKTMFCLMTDFLNCCNCFLHLSLVDESSLQLTSKSSTIVQVHSRYPRVRPRPGFIGIHCLIRHHGH